MSSPNEWVYITEQRNIPLREGRALDLDGERIAVFNLGDRVLAVDDRCPHRGGPLSDGILTGDTVVCPLHYWKVCLHTGRVKPPGEAGSCVKKYPVKVEDGRIFLAVKDAEVCGETLVAESANC